MSQGCWRRYLLNGRPLSNPCWFLCLPMQTQRSQRFRWSSITDRYSPLEIPSGRRARLDNIFAITEAKRELPSIREAQIEFYRQLWQARQETQQIQARITELEASKQEHQAQISAVEAERGEISAALQDQREQFVRVDYKQRELLKGLARIVDECDEIGRS